MPDVLAHTQTAHPPHTRPPALPRTVPDERPARQTLLEQVARLEEELAQLFCSTWPRKGFEWDVGSRGGPRLLGLVELEELRDDLAARVQKARRMLGDRTYVEEQSRRLIEEMMLEPERHKWVRVGNEDIGEPGCKHWHVRPRWGLLGMLLNWWRVRISSGCPLATRHPAPARASMGRRSRKRAIQASASTRAERDAARRAREASGSAARPRRRPGRPSIDERPPAPWGSFPLSELVILLGIVLIGWGLLSGRAGNARLAAGLIVASLGGGELALREHMAGYRSHTTLLAGAATFVLVTAVALLFGPVRVWALVALGAVVFAASFAGLRRLFKRRSGGLSFR